MPGYFGMVRQIDFQALSLLTARVDGLRHWVLILVDQVLLDIFNHQLVSRRRHPGVHKGGEVQERRAI